MSPCDWDQESHCCHDGCHAPATHQRRVGVEMVDCVGDGELFTETVEMVCCAHAIDGPDVDPVTGDEAATELDEGSQSDVPNWADVEVTP